MSGTRQILIVSDDALLRGLIAGVATQHALIPIEAHDYASALRRWRRRGPDILLVDAIMSSGWTRRLLDALACERPPPTRVVAIVGAGTGPEIAIHPIVGSTLVAPFTVAALTELFERLTSRSRRMTPRSGTRLKSAAEVAADESTGKTRSGE